MFLPLSSITVNLHLKIFAFKDKCCVGTKYLVLWQLFFPYPRAILASNYGIISSYLDCRGSFLACYEVEKRIDSSGKFLDLDENILKTQY